MDGVIELKDHPQPVASGTAAGWTAMSKTVRGVDEEKIKDHKEDIDTLLVFAGLFSAVLTAFVIESYKTLQPDPQLQVLMEISAQTNSYRMQAGFLNSTAIHNPTPSFQPQPVDIHINALWFSSLIISLITASLGMLVKQWLREYLAGEFTSGQARLRIRHFRGPGLEEWKVFQIAAALPLLIHLALGLFLLGLCLFTSTIHPTLAKTSGPLVAGWAFFITACIISPAFSPHCPYKTTLLKDVMRHARKYLIPAVHVIHLYLSIAFYDYLYGYCRKLLEVLGIVKARRVSALLLSIARLANFGGAALAARRDPRITLAIARPFKLLLATCSNWLERYAPHEEDRAVKTGEADLIILASVDAIQSDDELLAIDICGAVRQTQPEHSPEATIQFALEILGHRFQRSSSDMRSLVPLDLSPLTQRAYRAVTELVVAVMEREIRRQIPSTSNDTPSPLFWESWMSAALLLLLCTAHHSLPDTVSTTKTRIIRRCVEQNYEQIHIALMPPIEPDKEEILRGPERFWKLGETRSTTRLFDGSEAIKVEGILASIQVYDALHGSPGLTAFVPLKRIISSWYYPKPRVAFSLVELFKSTGTRALTLQSVRSLYNIVIDMIGENLENTKSQSEDPAPPEIWPRQMNEALQIVYIATARMEEESRTVKHTGSAWREVSTRYTMPKITEDLLNFQPFMSPFLQFLLTQSIRINKVPNGVTMSLLPVLSSSLTGFTPQKWPTLCGELSNLMTGMVLNPASSLRSSTSIDQLNLLGLCELFITGTHLTRDQEHPIQHVDQREVWCLLASALSEQHSKRDDMYSELRELGEMRERASRREQAEQQEETRIGRSEQTQPNVSKHEGDQVEGRQGGHLNFSRRLGVLPPNKRDVIQQEPEFSQPSWKRELAQRREHASRRLKVPRRPTAERRLDRHDTRTDSEWQIWRSVDNIASEFREWSERKELAELRELANQQEAELDRELSPLKELAAACLSSIDEYDSPSLGSQWNKTAMDLRSDADYSNWKQSFDRTKSPFGDDLIYILSKISCTSDTFRTRLLQEEKVEKFSSRPTQIRFVEASGLKLP